MLKIISISHNLEHDIDDWCFFTQYAALGRTRLLGLEGTNYGLCLLSHVAL